MKMHDGTTDFLKLFFSLLGFGVFVWWLESRFGAEYALVGIALLAGTFFVVVGVLLAAWIQKNAVSGVIDYAAKDAMTDRYRMQSLKELAKAGKEDLKNEGYRLKSDEAIRFLEAKKQAKETAPKPKSKEDTFWENDDLDLGDWG